MVRRVKVLALPLVAHVLLAACSSNSFGGGQKKVQSPSAQPTPEQQPEAKPQTQTKPETSQPSSTSTWPSGSSQPTHPETSIPSGGQTSVPPATTIPSSNVPSSNVPSSNVPMPGIPSDGETIVGYAHVPVTAYVNMEHGYHGLEEDTVFQLKDASGVVAAGWATIDAARNGKPTDGRGAYPGILLRMDLTYVRANVGYANGAASGSGQLNICHAADPSVTPERATCVAKSGAFGDGGDRPTAIMGERASWTLVQSQLDSKPEFNVDGDFNLSVFHPVWNYAAPGRGFKDYQSPLILDLGGDGLDLVDVWNDKVQVRFDLMDEGKVTRTGWVAAKDGFLALDLNGNGKIDNGLELFGEYTAGGREVPRGQKSWDHGFQALGQHDRNGDFVIDARDEVFGKLLVWRDKNQNGVSEKNEIAPLAKYDIVSLNLAHHKTGQNRFDIVANNEVRLMSSYKTKDGRERAMADVWFKQRRYSDGAVAKLKGDK
jgi:hypothetical protein